MKNFSMILLSGFLSSTTWAQCNCFSLDEELYEIVRGELNECEPTDDYLLSLSQQKSSLDPFPRRSTQTTICTVDISPIKPKP